MPILHVRNVPDELYERIRARAATHRRSITAETVALLEAGLAAEPAAFDPDGWLERVRAFRESLGAEGASIDVVELIHDGREERTRHILGE